MGRRAGGGESATLRPRPRPSSTIRVAERGVDTVKRPTHPAHHVPPQVVLWPGVDVGAGQ
eukprot:6452556-Pyramimonas_sp.AAC.1